MTQYEPFERGVEVNGQTVLAFVRGVPASFEEEARTILVENGIEDPDPGQWYAQEDWLNAFADIADQIGDGWLRQIGRSIPENADWPSGVDSIVEGLESIDEAYHMNHRGGEIGHYHAERVDDRTVHVRCRNPYPCAFDEGIVTAVTREFREGQHPRVVEVSRHCRSEGGDECVYEAKW